ncbi:MAG TPA: hypothetical protein VJH03_14805 [Blastocatellia bacterium]|nr:hypothetical protein [Blastocatellia bacterium]
MNKLALIIALPLLVLPGGAQSRNCLRITPVDELTRSASFIARVKVFKAGKANYRGSYSQLAVVRPSDVIVGDFTLKEVNVLARSNVQCAEDNYTAGQEMLVFLEPEGSLYHTVNFQFGQFLIDGEIVKGWRDKANKPIDKPYGEVRKEIEDYYNAVHNPQPPPQPQPTPPPAKPPTPQKAF